MWEVQLFPSSSQLVNVPVHVLFWHWSLVVQRLLSVQRMALAVCKHPPMASQRSSVQRFPSLQSTSAPAVHSPSSQPVSSRGTSTHPSAGSQTASAQGLSLVQVKREPAQKPSRHVSSSVQLSSSSQGAELNGWEHPPVSPSHTSSVHRSSSLQRKRAVWNTQPSSGSQKSVVQALPSLQSTAIPWQIPLEQVSSVVQ